MPKKDYLRFFLDAQGKQFVEDIKASEKTQEHYRKRYERKKQRLLPWQGVGAVERTMPFERGIRIYCSSGIVEICLIASDCLRVHFTKNGIATNAPISFAIVNSQSIAVPFEVIEGTEALELRFGQLICRIGKIPFRLGIETLDHQVICLDTQGMALREDGAIRLSMALQTDESCYGLGERASGLDLRGKRVKLWNTDPDDFDQLTDPLFCNIPFYLGIHRYGSYGVFWDNPGRGVADFTTSEREEFYFEAETGTLCYYLFLAKDVPSILSRYTELTGRISLPPIWSLSYQEIKSRNSSINEWSKNIEQIRSKQAPFDVIAIDSSEIVRRDSDESSRKLFKNSLETLKNQGFKVLVVTQPGVSVRSVEFTNENIKQRNIFLKYPDGEIVTGVNWSGLGYFVDFGSDDAQAWWFSYIENLLADGADGIYVDMNEPVVFSSEGMDTLPDCVEHHVDNINYSHAELHNAYALLIAKATFEAIRKHQNTLRPFFASRAGYAGIQRYGANWISESIADWEHLTLGIKLALNMSLSGVSLIGSEIPVDESGQKELFTRWLQATCLMPLCRSRITSGNDVQGLWFPGQPYEVVNKLTVQLRYRLMPYLYSVIAQSKEYGWPIIRPLFMSEADNLSLRSVDDCYMVGDGLLVAPVVAQGAVQRTVYLPPGIWYDYWTNEVFDGGQNVTVPAPLERLPLFVRGGVVLPHWPEMNQLETKPFETLLYRVYPGERETVLYEDRGEGMEYEQGDYRWIYITSHWDDAQFIIERRVAGRYKQPYRNHRVEIVGFDEEPARVQVDWQAAPLWFYDDGILDLTVDSFQRIEVTRKPQASDETLVRRPW